MAAFRHVQGWQDASPVAIAGWMSGVDAAACDRAFAATLQMAKLDIAALARAYQGR